MAKTDLPGCSTIPGLRFGRVKTFTLVATASIVMGCTSEGTDEPLLKPGLASPTTGQSEGKCVELPVAEYRTVEDKQVTADMLKLALPDGTCFFGVGTVDLPDRPGKISIRIDLTVPASNGPEDLRSVATDIAHMLKGTEIARRTSVVMVTNWGFTKPKYRALLSDENFDVHPWNGTPSRDAELAIWTVLDQK